MIFTYNSIGVKTRLDIVMMKPRSKWDNSYG